MAASRPPSHRQQVGSYRGVSLHKFNIPRKSCRSWLASDGGITANIASPASHLSNLLLIFNVPGRVAGVLFGVALVLATIGTALFITLFAFFLGFP